MTPHTPAPMRVTIAANNGDIGGGEVMLLNIAHACEELGVDVTVVGPSQPSGLVDAARAAGHRTVVLEARGRKEWMRALRRWDRGREGVLWCNGFVPALATAGHGGRIVHLHAVVSRARRALLTVARFGALVTLVPSRWMQERLRSTEAFPNWVEPVVAHKRAATDDDPFIVGYLGRVSVEKGVPVLAEAMRMLEKAHPGRFRLFVAGESRFVSEQDRAAVDRALNALGAQLERTGWIDPAEFFSRVDLAVCPSVAPETFGLVAAEALSARTPLIVSDAGALPEVAGSTGDTIVPAGDAAALAQAILAQSSMTDDTEIITGFERWSTEFSPDAGRGRTRELLTRIGVAAEEAR